MASKSAVTESSTSAGRLPSEICVVVVSQSAFRGLYISAKGETEKHLDSTWNKLQEVDMRFLRFRRRNRSRASGAVQVRTRRLAGAAGEDSAGGGLGLTYLLISYAQTLHA